MNYFLSIVLHHERGFIYQLTKGMDIHSMYKVCDISRRGAKLWFKEHNSRLVFTGRRVLPFEEEGLDTRTLLVNRVYQFYENS